jgi:dipeptidyl aminopeptidase/acylaminoacyl peptidase
MSRGKKRTLFALVLVVALSLLAAVPALGAAKTRTSANLHEEPGGSGVTATINFDDDGTTVRIRGHASGMDPGTTYISLIYDNGSVDTGEFACLPTDGSIIDRMFVGVWKVLPNGNGILMATNFELDGGGKVYVSPDDFNTISVRIAGTGDLVACGIEG